MNRYKKYLILILAVILAGWGLSHMADNTRHNTQMVVYNQTGQSLVRIQLKTEKTKKNLHFNSIEDGAELSIHYHLDTEDSGQLFLQLADGRQWMSDPTPIGPGKRVVHRVTKEGIDTLLKEMKTD